MRENGFYAIRYWGRETWTIAEWVDGKWFLCGNPVGYNDIEFAEAVRIDPEKIAELSYHQV